jgi:hypothetical protein
MTKKSSREERREQNTSQINSFLIKWFYNQTKLEAVNKREKK